MAAGVMAGAAIAANIARLKAGIDEAFISWKGLEARGLVLEREQVTGSRAASGKLRPLLTGAIEGGTVEIRIRSNLVHVGGTEIAATLSVPAAVKVGVHPTPQGVLGYLRSLIGQDIVLGDEWFDEQFLVTARPHGAAAQLLDERTREKILALLEVVGPRFGGMIHDGARVLVALLGVQTSPAALERALDVVSAAARWTFSP